MKNKANTVKTKSLKALLAACCLLPAFSTPVYATNPQMGRLSSSRIPAVKSQEETDGFTITLTSGSAGSLEGRSFSIYRIFTATTGENGAIAYAFDPATQEAVKTLIANKTEKGSETITAQSAAHYISQLTSHTGSDHQESDTSDFRSFCQELRDALGESASCQTVMIQSTDLEDGNFKIENLPKGYYLMDEVTASEGEKENYSSSLCLASTITEDQTITLKGVYPTLEKKIKEDDLEENEGWNDIGDYEIGQTIPYRYEVTIPPIAAYSTYQLIFHDVMDAALDFDPESVQVQIKGAGENSATYTLKKTEGSNPEYAVKTGDQAGNGNTFSIEIADIKAILDKEFSSPEETPNVYGQKVVITYSGSLNADAAVRTGRPGFENKARLEYSNNPDSNGTGQTGFTPWDSVVCFTYQLDGNKLNDRGTSLGGAHFRLYRDEELHNEVKLKKIATGYSVFNPEKEDETTAEDIITENDGKISIFGLDQGTYYLQETQAPDGYHPPLSPVTLTITPTFPDDRNTYQSGLGAGETILSALSGTSFYTEYLNGDSKEVKNSSLSTEAASGRVNFEVVNRPGEKLPLTGANTALVCLAGGSVIVLAAGALHLLGSGSRKPRDGKRK